MIKRIVIVLLVAGAWVASAQERQTYRFVERDSALRLDVYRPEVQRSDKACVVALFGGGFVIGERDDSLAWWPSSGVAL